MLISKYSAPDFDPYGDNTPVEPDALWLAPVADGAVRARVSLPGSKSITNRELVLASLAGGSSLIRAPLHSKDSANMVQALRALGVRIEERDGSGAFGDDWLVIPPEELTGSTTIDCGQAGTVMRFVPPVAALALGPTTFDADDSARGRPMGGIVSALRALGVDLDDAGRGGLPFTVHGTGRVAGGAVEIDASASSQFVSALLLSAARFDDGLRLTHVGERLPSLPHIEMTIDALARRGVKVESPATGEWIVTPGTIAARDVDIEPDLSNAAPFLAAAIATGGSVSVTDWPDATTQVGAELAGILPAFGAAVERADGALTVRGGDGIRGVELDLSAGGELAPTIVALAALADSPSTITGIGHIRNHETDRLAALANEIRGLGGEVDELDDGLRIVPRPLHGGVWHSYEDHRMSTTGALIGLVVPGVQIENVEATHKTLPQFTALWRDMVTGDGDQGRLVAGG
ncbi:3-phosphoshikimate 1-carboxyvinyltransferase [Humibacter sp. RRB41]|uniref:3-phosphoshikimate 1-carboxyvinyltransferase n=1 Tax=Humibacter sp. RRB41 TaxID=2919946 RepID=UPI001FAAA080|nr:3-phosphoshikimate 1-carboxyvinyltransferase [Humibacter sp. RRB41]